MTWTRTFLLLLRIASRNVRRGWRHSLAAIGTMAVGFVALATFQGYLDELLGSQLEMSYARNMIGEIMVRKPGSGGADARVWPERFWLDEGDQAFVDDWVRRQGPEIKASVRSILVQGLATTGGTSAAFMGIGYDVGPGRIARRNWTWNAWAGHPIRDDEPSGVLIGLGLGKLLGCEPASKEPVFDPKTALPKPVERPMKCQTTTLQLTGSAAGGRVNALDAEVVGLGSGEVREFDQRMLWAPLPLMQRLVETKSVALYNLLLRDPSQAATLRADLKAQAAQAGRKLEVVDWKETEHAELFRRGEELLGTYRSLVVLVLLVIAGSAVLTTMAKTVRERTREIGTLRSLGYRRGHMLAMFVLEAGVLALVAAGLGALLATGLRLGVNAAGWTYSAGLLAEDIVFRIGWSPLTYALGCAYLTGVALLAAWLAARQAVRLKVAEALTVST